LQQTWLLSEDYIILLSVVTCGNMVTCGGLPPHRWISVHSLFFPRTPVVLRVEMQEVPKAFSKLSETANDKKGESYPRSFFALQVSLVDGT
jgi:hypothetical protein